MLVAKALIARLAGELAARCRAARVIAVDVRGACGCCCYFGHCNVAYGCVLLLGGC